MGRLRVVDPWGCNRTMCSLHQLQPSSKSTYEIIKSLVYTPRLTVYLRNPWKYTIFNDSQVKNLDLAIERVVCSKACTPQCRGSFNTRDDRNVPTPSRSPPACRLCCFPFPMLDPSVPLAHNHRLISVVIACKLSPPGPSTVQYQRPTGGPFFCFQLYSRNLSLKLQLIFGASWYPFLAFLNLR
jgi:hypothetical protein